MFLLYQRRNQFGVDRVGEDLWQQCDDFLIGLFKLLECFQITLFRLLKSLSAENILGKLCIHLDLGIRPVLCALRPSHESGPIARARRREAVCEGA